MKLFFCSLFVLGSLFAEDKPKTPPQPTIEERFDLLKTQRDFLLIANQTLQAQSKQVEAGNALDQKASAVSTKYNCLKWNDDFTCTVKEPEKAKK